jgi:hypothetical protein
MNLIVLENTAYTPNNIKKHIQNSYQLMNLIKNERTTAVLI